MKKIALALAAFLAVALAAPVATTTAAQAETVVVKKKIIHGDRGHHWRHANRGHHYGWRNSHAKKVVIIKKKRHWH